jgi:hypothetical protein
MVNDASDSQTTLKERGTEKMLIIHLTAFDGESNDGVKVYTHMSGPSTMLFDA